MQKISAFRLRHDPLYAKPQAFEVHIIHGGYPKAGKLWEYQSKLELLPRRSWRGFQYRFDQLQQKLSALEKQEFFVTVSGTPNRVKW